MVRAQDARGWRRFCLTILWPGIAVFGLFAWAASSATGASHGVLLGLTILTWLIELGLGMFGWRRYFRS